MNCEKCHEKVITRATPGRSLVHYKYANYFLWNTLEGTKRLDAEMMIGAFIWEALPGKLFFRATCHLRKVGPGIVLPIDFFPNFVLIWYWSNQVLSKHIIFFYASFPLTQQNFVHCRIYVWYSICEARPKTSNSLSAIFSSQEFLKYGWLVLNASF